jgi:hypothetical protein
MRYPKNGKGALMAASYISLKELTEMAAFIRSFKEKYNRRRNLVRKRRGNAE